MKKSNFIALLSLGLLITSCATFNQPTQNQIIESDDAHEEIFGGVAFNEYSLKRMNKSLTLDESLVAPKIGYQTKDNGNNTTSIRFTAAIAALDVSATWTRSVHQKDGTQLKAKDTIESTKAYTALNSGGSLVDATTIDDGNGNTPYHYFVVYCLLNVPNTQLDNYFDAYLTLEKETESISSNVLSVNVANSYSTTYTLSEGYKMFVNGVVYESDANKGDNRYQKEGFAIQAGDEVIIRDYGDLNFVEYGNSSLATLTQLFDESSDHRMVPLLDGTYNFYLNKDGQLWITTNLGYYILGEFGSDSTRYWKADNGVKSTQQTGGNVAEFLNIYLESGRDYKLFNLSNGTSYNPKNPDGDVRFEPGALNSRDNFQTKFTDYYNIYVNGEHKMYFDAVMREGVNNFFVYINTYWYQEATSRGYSGSSLRYYLEYRKVVDDVEEERDYCDLQYISGSDCRRGSLDYSKYNRVRVRLYKDWQRSTLILETDEIDVDPTKNYIRLTGAGSSNFYYSFY